MDKMRVGIVIVSILLIGGLYYGFRAIYSSLNPSERAVTNTPEQVASESGQVATLKKTILIEIVKDQVSERVQTIKLKPDEEVVVSFLADRDTTVHIHGYDILVDLKKNQGKQIEFKATTTGRFEYELEDNGKVLGVIEVSPE